jgi:DnaJ-class molecular chaperone
MRLRGKGMPELHGGARGDLYVKIDVQVPEKLGARETELLKELQSIWNTGEAKDGTVADKGGSGGASGKSRFFNL